MKKNKYRFLVKNVSILTIACCFLLIGISGCSKEEDPLAVDSKTFCQAVLDGDETILSTLMLKFTEDLQPTPTVSDPLGHEENFNTLIERINGITCTEASFICYGCIQTLPVQSEIGIKVNLDGNETEVVMDINTPEDEPLRFLRLHD